MIRGTEDALIFYDALYSAALLCFDKRTNNTTWQKPRSKKCNVFFVKLGKMKIQNLWSPAEYFLIHCLWPQEIQSTSESCNCRRLSASQSSVAVNNHRLSKTCRKTTVFPGETHGFFHGFLSWRLFSTIEAAVNSHGLRIIHSKSWFSRWISCFSCEREKQIEQLLLSGYGSTKGT